MRLEIPVFHDDQHGTAIIAAAGLINALHLTGRDISDIRVVSNGAGAASIACVELFKSMGVPHENIILVEMPARWRTRLSVRTSFSACRLPVR